MARADVPQIGGRLNRLGSAGATSGMLPIGESAALAAAGFVPVSEVVGAVAMRAPTSGFFQYGSVGAATYPRGWQGDGRSAPPVFTSSHSSRVPSFVAVSKKAYRLALTRLTDEIRAAGADGAVGVRIEHTVVRAGTADSVWRFLATGTAIRSLGPTRAARPFTTPLSAGETAAALGAGWAPITLLACPVMAVRWVDQESRRQERALSGNGEVAAISDAVNACRRQAAVDFERDARVTGADGAVLHDMTVELGDAPDLAEVKVVLTGTALARFGVPRSPTALTVLSLGNRR